MTTSNILEEDLTKEIIGAAIEVHKHWGPGLYEQIYERSLCHELKSREIPFQNQLQIPLLYKDQKVGDNLSIDMFVNEKVVVEIKAVSDLLPIHESQLLTYMKLTKSRVGLLINFNVPILKSGIKRRVL
jgi:GxxExxY protein